MAWLARQETVIGVTAVVLLLPSLAWTQPLPVWMRCEADVRAQLAGWNATDEMFEDAGHTLGRRVWRIATRRVGTWIVLGVDTQGIPALARVHGDETHHLGFDPSCSAQERLAPSRFRAAPAVGAAFDDLDLRALLAEHDAGLIYVWSPHMPLSVDGYRHAAAAAATLGIHLTAVLDPASDPGYARTAATEAGLPDASLRPFHSAELLFRNATLHAPSLLTFARGRMIGLAIPGYRSESDYRRAIASRLGGTK